MPLEWIGYQDAVRLISLGQVSYSLGSMVYRIHGGINAATGQRSIIDGGGSYEDVVASLISELEADQPRA